MNKKDLVGHIITHIEKELNSAVSAAQSTYEAATHEESKPENEYDTRGLEASYLAGAQAKRVGELEEILYLFKNTPLKYFTSNDKIASTALVELLQEGKNGSSAKNLYVFLMSKGGGEALSIQNKLVQVITPSSPLGQALLGLNVGESAVVEFGNKTNEYEVISIQ